MFSCISSFLCVGSSVLLGFETAFSNSKENRLGAKCWIIVSCELFHLYLVPSRNPALEVPEVDFFFFCPCNACCILLEKQRTHIHFYLCYRVKTSLFIVMSVISSSLLPILLLQIHIHLLGLIKDPWYKKA